mmetsp:Transcript_11062/g.20677  ORF Transcript_11062/g.20677 Transcript_11062/m.20677 type:complete len:417 (-) Transcript_11062:94-1344(-)|eukprot:CAMPEP_0176499870 /NCGR_PEP_ID=MMETSP0200_2-20121128/13191_1 /TAXON_ID=947934 /ORGANISM="Chaetoceros sp., Strain GSL56" /LENGTH=416 /DNA_ID=CAMNT_0017898385 /DNA_START=468 /DNA_END=1718 /DNA_ORIENTATION=+
MSVTASACVADAIARLCHQIILVPEKRDKATLSMKFFLDMIATGETKTELLRYGRISNLVGLASLADTYFLNETYEDVIVADIETEDWNLFLKGLCKTRRTLLRNDATTLQLPILQKQVHGDDEGFSKNHKVDDRINEKLAAKSIFGQEFNQIVMLCLVHQALSIIRPYIDGTQALSREVIVSALQFIKANFPFDDFHGEHLLSLFETDEKQSQVPELKPLDEVRNILQQRRDFSLQNCIKRCQRLIQNWYLEVFHDHLPLDMNPVAGQVLVRREQTPKRLKRERQSLATASISAAQKSSNGGVFSGENDVASPASSKRKKFRPTISSPDYTGILVDLPRASPKESDDFISPMRRKWTDDETECVIIGVEKFGKGQWKKIKDSFPKKLKHRSNVQIKDRWRTLEILKQRYEEENED